MTPNMAPMAGDDVEDQMVYVGAMVEVQSNFSDPDEDMLSYTATILATMMDVATATVDDMGMVTITGVAEGMATITVTASDPGGTVRHADHHGHRRGGRTWPPWPAMTSQTRWSMSAPWSRCRATSLTPTKTCCPTWHRPT